MSVVVGGGRLIACYAMVMGVEVDDERWGAAIAWVAETNQNVIVGNFELLGEQYELEGNRERAALVLRAADFPPMRYEFRRAALAWVTPQELLALPLAPSDRQFALQLDGARELDEV